MIQISDTLQLNTTVNEVLSLLKRESRNSDLFYTIKRNGDNIQTNCPFHKDKKPSFGINSDGLWHCFSCNRKGNLASLVKYILNLPSYEMAEDWLIANFNTVITEDEIPLIDFRAIHEKKKSESKGETVYVDEKELDKYRYYHPYMFKRGLTKDIINKYDVGLDQKYKHGIAITFPVRDIQGRTLFIARRCVDNKIFNYPKGAEKPLYGVYELNKYWPDAKEIWICESIIDCLRLACNNIPAIALNGLGSDYQYKLIKDLGIKSIVLATDMDEPGQKARANIKKRIKGVFFKEAILPKGKKDIGECTDEEIKNIQIRL